MTNPQAQDMLDFINYAWTPFHAVEEGCRRLVAAGFNQLHEKDAWHVQPGGKYFFTRNQTSLVAFAVGAKYSPGNGFCMVGAHTDSPCPKLKPNSKLSKSDFTMLNIEPYGGGLWATWFDRDLSVAGRVIIRNASGVLESKLVKINKPIARIPMLAIHLNRELSSEGFKINAQNHLSPLLCSAPPKDQADPATARHSSMLLNLLVEELNCSTEAIVDLELQLCDIVPGTIGGAKDEYVFVGRLDNLAMSYCSIAALIAASSDASLEDETGVRAVALFDHEEVGSSSAYGAGGPIMRDTITRVASLLANGVEGAAERALRQSFLVSADMAHAVHPNYSDKHEPQHQPKMNAGLVVKHNVNQRYATNSVSAAIFRELGLARNIACQEFCVRSDMPCGSTIGPILSSLLGCKTVDVGVAQLSMHSVREMCGAHDIKTAIEHFVAVFEGYFAMAAMTDFDSLPSGQILGELHDVACHHTH